MDDFERRRELRRQKREEMRQEVERVTYQRNDDDEEEAARERRRRARQDRQRVQKDDGEGHEVNSSNSITGDETRSVSTTNADISADDEAALLDRLAKREERRQKRLKEAMERQKEFDPTISITTNETISISRSTRNGEDQDQDNDAAPKVNDTETHKEHVEVEETETVDQSFEKNDRKKEEEPVETDQAEAGQDVQNEEPEEPLIEDNQVKDEKFSKDKGSKDELKASWERKKGFPESKAQNGEVTPQKLKHLDKFGGAKAQDEADAGSKVEAGKKLDDLRRRRGDAESGEFEKLKQKKEEASVELEELKKRREERKKLMEEEEQRKKQEEAERKAKEEEEKKRLKEEIERRRAEAAEKRQKLPEDGVSEDKKPFKCFTPKGSLKIEERAEFLNKSSQKSIKSTQPTVVSKIDSRLEQYTSAIGSNKGPRTGKAAPSDLPLATEGVRNIKSMWEKGNVFSSPGGVTSPNKETAGLKVGVSSRINDWLTKTPETKTTPLSKPSDLRPGDVSGKRNLWEKPQVEKSGSPAKVAIGGKKSDTNGLRFEKEP